jgi:hypothetical protein
MNTRRGAEEANRESSTRDLHEMKDRLRRMETRLVKLFEHLGLDTERKLPDYGSGVVNIPSMMTSIEDIMRALPEGTKLPINVFHKKQYVVTLVPGARP